MAVNIQLRRDSAAQWTVINPILAEGELGYELDTRRLKVGNGVDRWVDLPYSLSKDHNDLTGRDQENAHPISAITNLAPTLDTFLTQTQPLDGGNF